MEPGGLQQVDRAFHIDALIKRRRFEAGTNSGARGEMDDLIKSYAAAQIVQAGTMEQIVLDKSEFPGERLHLAEILQFERRVIKGVQIIQRPDGMAFAQQPFAHVRANETR